MVPQSIPIFALIATCLTLSIPPVSSILQLPSQNQTISSPANVTGSVLGKWDDPPIIKYLGGDTDTEITSVIPSSDSDPTSKRDVLDAISSIKVKALAEARLNLIKDFKDSEGPVEFGFHATDDLFRGSDVAMLLDQLWNLMNQNGIAELYGQLNRRGDLEPIARFGVVIQKPFIEE